jgi:hypothetical protein
MTQTGTPSGEFRVALAFFGITRSLKLTIGSIRENLVAPARELAADVRLFGHFYDQDKIDNVRSEETGALDPEEYRLLQLDGVEREPPDACLAQYDLPALQANGDPWGDGFVSLRNLVHQLHSLRRVTEMALAWRPDLVIFARPDLYYHDTVSPDLTELADIDIPCVVVPDWSQWSGYNDRFAMAKGETAIRAYGMRIDRLGDYCRQGKQPHSERFLKHALGRIPVAGIPLRASRVRSTGLVVVEDFTPGHGKASTREHVPFETFVRSMGAPERAQHQGAQQ